MILIEWLFREIFENRIKKLCNSKPLRQMARDNTKIDDKELNKELAKKIINPFYFTDRALQVGLNISLESHHINHANSKFIIKINYPEFGIEVRYINEIIKELSIVYARLVNQYIFKCQTVLPARIDKQDEDNQVLDEAEFFTNLNINHNLKQSDLDKIDIRSPSEHQIQQQEMRDSGWRFEKVSSMTAIFYTTGEMNGRSFV